ncbi:MAG: hypothetical protein ACFB2Z_10350 [Maricaulaceae bacterium]
MRWLTAGLALALCASAGAQDAPDAQGGAEADITGAWAFQTELYELNAQGEGCRMTGEMTIIPEGDGFQCRFTAREKCPLSQHSAEQICTLTRQGDRLLIEAVILRVDPPTISYAPDNFSLTIENSGLMRGRLVSADIAPVTFYRDAGLVS